MRLFLSADEAGGAHVLSVRFDDVSEAEPGAPVELIPFVDAAHERLRKRFSDFIQEFALTTGLLDIPGWRRALAAYWLVPFSERSPMRSSLIERLYQLTLLDLAIRKHQPRQLRVVTGDERFWHVIARLALAHGIAASRPTPSASLREASVEKATGLIHRLGIGVWRILRARARLAADAWSKWRLLRHQARDIIGTCDRGPIVAFYTRYPVLWEYDDGKPSLERNFAGFPNFLSGKGYQVVYVAAYSASGAQLRSTLAAVRAEARQHRVVFLDGLVSLGELLRTYSNVAPAFRYLRWRARLGRRPIPFDGLDVRELVLAELDAEFLYGSELLSNYARADALRRFSAMCSPRAIFHPFEYQPMERAICAGAVSGSTGTSVVGIQTSIFAVNRPAWWYALGEVAMPPRFPTGRKAPWPHYVVAYGTEAIQTFSRYCPAERVLPGGAIRYTHLRAADTDMAVGSEEGPPRPSVLVACTIMTDETRLLLRVALELSRARSELEILLKFHYHNPMHAEWADMADRAGCRRFRVFETNLVELLRRARVVLLGWSSTSLIAEAITFGCMPVVLQPPSRFSFGCAFDAREAIFTCEDETAMVGAVLKCLADSPEYRRRRAAWPRVLEDLLGPMDGLANQRLYAQLTERGVL